MTIRVVQSPSPIVTPAELGGVAVDNAVAEALIAAVTAELDGPMGKLGRCFGPQTIEATFPAAQHFDLPCPPLIDVVSIIYHGESGEVAAVPADYYVEDGRITFVNSSFSGAIPEGRKVRIRYRAGYDGEENGTGDLPPQITQAIILKARLMASAISNEIALKADEVEGVGRQEFTLPEQINTVIERAVDSLVSGLKVYRL